MSWTILYLVAALVCRRNLEGLCTEHSLTKEGGVNLYCTKATIPGIQRIQNPRVQCTEMESPAESYSAAIWLK